MDLYERRPATGTNVTAEDFHDWSRKVSRRHVLKAGVAGAGVLALSPMLWQRAGYAATLPEGIHLEFGTDTTSEMVVSWLTTENVQGAAIDIGTDMSYGLTVPADTRTVAGTATTYHHAPITGLQSDTTYHYRVRHDGAIGADHTFSTGSPAAQSFRFCAFGDQGTGTGALAVISRVAALVPSFVFHVGDLCYASMDGGFETLPLPVNQATWDTWFRSIEGVASRAPWMTTVGNGEIEYGYGPQGYDGYLARFDMPSSNAPALPVSYSFTYGNVGFVALDANDVSYEIRGNTGYTQLQQTTWLANTLSSMRANPHIDFIVVGHHECAYCCHGPFHGSDGGVREHWSPLFDQYSVDLVISGHNHAYERSYPLRGGRVTSTPGPGGQVNTPVDGTTYITAGGGGMTDVPTPAFTYPIGMYTTAEFVKVPEDASWSAVRHLGFSLLAVDVQKPSNGLASMQVNAFTPDGTVIDTVTISRPR